MGAIASPVIAGLSLLSPTSGLVPIVKTVTGLANIIGGAGGDSASDQQRKAQELALRQLKVQQRAGQQQLETDTALERERLALSAQDAADERRSALRRAVARQQAQFGASGIGTGEGSAQAVLLGLFQESDEDRAAREQMDSLRNKALDLSLENNQSLNVLQRTQLQERQKLARLF